MDPSNLVRLDFVGIGLPEDIPMRVYDAPASPDSYQAFLMDRAVTLADGVDAVAQRIYQHLNRAFDSLVWAEENADDPELTKERIWQVINERIEREIAKPHHPATSDKEFVAQGPRTADEDELGLRGVMAAADVIRQSRREDLLRKRDREESS